MKKIDFDMSDFELEIHQISEATVIEEMGASIGSFLCCSSVVKDKMIL